MRIPLASTWTFLSTKKKEQPKPSVPQARYDVPREIGAVFEHPDKGPTQVVGFKVIEMAMSKQHIVGLRALKTGENFVDLIDQ